MKHTTSGCQILAGRSIGSRGCRDFNVDRGIRSSAKIFGAGSGQTPRRLWAAFAAGINNAGQVAGTAELMMPNNPNRFSKAVVWNNGTPTVLDTPASRYIYRAAAINDAGQVAGWAYTSDGYIGPVPVMWNGVTPTVLDLPQGATSGLAYGINSNGVVVGIGFFHPDISVTYKMFHL